MRKIHVVAITCAILAVPSQALAGWVNATVARQAMVYRQANDTSEALGHLREGKVIRIYVPDRNGFYAVNFGRPIKGTQTGWIAVGDVQLQDAAPAAGGGQTASRRTPKNKMKASWLDFTFNLLLVSPSTFQSGLGEATGGLTGTEFALAYGHRFPGSALGFAFGAFYYKVDGVGTLNPSYGAKGFGGSAGLDYQFVNQNQFSVSGLASVGMSINSAGNTNTASQLQYNTTNIIAFPLKIELDLRKYFGAFGFIVGGGYQIEKLSEVPIVTGGTQASPVQSTADFGLSGLYGKFGVTLNFE